jgi:RNA polymerase sigma-70 factor (sigma-E family)
VRPKRFRGTVLEAGEVRAVGTPDNEHPGLGAPPAKPPLDTLTPWDSPKRSPTLPEPPPSGTQQDLATTLGSRVPRVNHRVDAVVFEGEGRRVRGEDGECMPAVGDFDGLEVLIAERGAALLATATLLAGGRLAGEDLLQAALERVMKRWHDIHGELEPYLRRAMYHLAVDQWRARGRRPEVLGQSVAQIEASSRRAREPDGAEEVQLRQALLQGLAQLPARQRAVLVLRYWEQLSEAESAEMLGCSIGTVKSTASRGLVRLRAITAAWTVGESPAGESSVSESSARKGV